MKWNGITGAWGCREKLNSVWPSPLLSPEPRWQRLGWKWPPLRDWGPWGTAFRSAARLQDVSPLGRSPEPPERRRRGATACSSSPLLLKVVWCLFRWPRSSCKPRPSPPLPSAFPNHWSSTGSLRTAKHINYSTKHLIINELLTLRYTHYDGLKVPLIPSQITREWRNCK